MPVSVLGRDPGTPCRPGTARLNGKHGRPDSTVNPNPPRPPPTQSHTPHTHTAGAAHPGQVPSPRLPRPVARSPPSSPSPRSPRPGAEAPNSVDVDASAVGRRASWILRPRHVVGILAPPCSIDLARAPVDWICSGASPSSSPDSGGLDLRICLSSVLSISGGLVLLSSVSGSDLVR